jgi:hypothetical protein
MTADKRLIGLALAALIGLPAALPAQNYPFTPYSPARAARLASRVSEQARQFVSMVPVDLGNSYKGRQLLDDGNHLIAACDRFQQSLQDNVPAQQRWLAFQGLRQSFRDTADDIRGVYPNAPNATEVINLMAQHINALIEMGFDRPPPSSAPPPQPTVPPATLPPPKSQP